METERNYDPSAVLALVISNIIGRINSRDKKALREVCSASKRAINELISTLYIDGTEQLGGSFVPLPGFPSLRQVTVGAYTVDLANEDLASFRNYLCDTIRSYSSSLEQLEFLFFGTRHGNFAVDAMAGTA